ncbi:hypothetical protein OSTOST_21893 [Ostertagia ostertagi]
MGTPQLLFIIILSFVAVVLCDAEDPFRELKSINPIMRYWAQSRLRKKLPLLEKLDLKKKETADSQKYRNCYFSPVQCQLPVLINIDPLASAIKPDLQQDFYSRYRRFSQSILWIRRRQFLYRLSTINVQSIVTA